MCCLSCIGQILYGAVMIAALGLTLASMFSPGWTDLKKVVNASIEEIKDFHLPEGTGIFAFLCKAPGENDNNSGGTSFDYCEEWFNNLPGWMKAVVATMCLALITEAVAVVWTIVTLCACCCKQCLIYPLPILSLILTIFLAIAVIVYGINNKDAIALPPLDEDIVNNVKDLTEVGYSFYLAIGALIGAAVDIVIGCLTVCLGKKCL